MGADIPVLGIGVRAPKDVQEANVFKLAAGDRRLLGHRDRVTREMVVADCDYVGAGYGLIDQGVIDALKLAARTEGILLDPVYSGKAMKGLIALSRWAVSTARPWSSCTPAAPGPVRLPGGLRPGRRHRALRRRCRFDRDRYWGLVRRCSGLRSALSTAPLQPLSAERIYAAGRQARLRPPALR